MTTAFDPSNPTTYDSEFKAFIRQKGLAGKEVDVDQVRALYDEFGGSQAQATEQATSLFAGIPDPTPNATAAASDTSFTAPRMDLTDMTALTGGSKGPIMSTVEQVTQQEQEAAQQEAPQEDPVGIFYRDRVVPVIKNFRQRRQQTDNNPELNSYEKRMALGAINSDIEANVSNLQEAGVFGDQELNYYRTLTTEDKELPREEALFRTFQFKMSPQKQQSQGGIVANEQTGKMLDNATKIYDSAVRFAEANPENPAAVAAVESASKAVQAAQKQTGISPDRDLMGEYKDVRRNVETLYNAQTDNIPAIIIDGQEIGAENYDEAIKGFQARLGTYEASPDFRNAVPVIDENKFKDPKDFIAAVQAADQVYRDSSGRLVTPQRFEEEEKKARFKTFKAQQNEVVPPPEADRPKGIPVGEKNMIRYAIEKGDDLTNTRFTPEMIATVREEMNEEQIEGALRSLYAGNSWASKVGLRNPTIKDEDMSGMLGRTDDPEAANFLSGIDPETVKRVYEKADRLQGVSARAYKNSDGSWSSKIDTPDMVLSRIRKLASKRGK